LVSPFLPEFVYPLFGEAQVIYGYEDLDVQLRYASGSLATFVGIKYTAKIPETSSLADDVEGILYKFLPADYLKNPQTFEDRVESDAKEFRPFGTLIASYARRPIVDVKGKGKGKSSASTNGVNGSNHDWETCSPDDEGAIVYEAWSAKMDTPGFREYHRRMQIFVLFYIEGGSYIEEEDERWEFVILYEKRNGITNNSASYHFVAYASLYPFFFWPDKIRLRLAQFIILPPYQQSGHGSALYSIIYYWVLSRTEVAELTVEDPSEAFQDLRDKTDLKRLISEGRFNQIRAPLDKAWSAKTRSELKLAERQFARLVEMILLLSLDPKDPVASRAYRLLVKERLYRFNYDLLASMEKGERRETLRTTYEGVLDEYQRLTAGLTFRPN